MRNSPLSSPVIDAIKLDPEAMEAAAAAAEQTGLQTPPAVFLEEARARTPTLDGEPATAPSESSEPIMLQQKSRVDSLRLDALMPGGPVRSESVRSVSSLLVETGSVASAGSIDDTAASEGPVMVSTPREVGSEAASENAQEPQEQTDVSHSEETARGAQEDVAAPVNASAEQPLDGDETSEGGVDSLLDEYGRDTDDEDATQATVETKAEVQPEQPRETSPQRTPSKTIMAPSVQRDDEEIDRFIRDVEAGGTPSRTEDIASSPPGEHPVMSTYAPLDGTQAPISGVPESISLSSIASSTTAAPSSDLVPTFAPRERPLPDVPVSVDGGDSAQATTAQHRDDLPHDAEGDDDDEVMDPDAHRASSRSSFARSAGSRSPVGHRKPDGSNFLAHTNKLFPDDIEPEDTQGATLLRSDAPPPVAPPKVAIPPLPGTGASVAFDRHGSNGSLSPSPSSSSRKSLTLGSHSPRLNAGAGPSSPGLGSFSGNRSPGAGMTRSISASSRHSVRSYYDEDDDDAGAEPGYVRIVQRK